MSITVVGSIAFDRVRTPSGERERMLGGAATHFALAASFFDAVHVVGPVGEDFTNEHLTVLGTRGTLVTDVERVQGGRTFFWHGTYGSDLDDRKTLATELGVFADFDPDLSAQARDCDVLFLANIQPGLQAQVREQCVRARFVALDTMNLWIDVARAALLDVIGCVDCLLVNDAELRQLTGTADLVAGAHAVLGWGPRAVVVKQGQYGATLVTADSVVALPAYPVEKVVDPTGAGDTFAGGFVGFIARHTDGAPGDDDLRRAMAHGTALASFNVEGFGTDRVVGLTADELHERADALHDTATLGDGPAAPVVRG